MSRWDHIKAEVSKFSRYMAEMIHFIPSGMSDADKSMPAATDFANVEKHNFTLMHYWQIMKDEPKWMELKRKMDTPQNSGSRENAPPQCAARHFRSSSRKVLINQPIKKMSHGEGHIKRV